ncbi:hypothetical protein ACO0RG_002618 [Hanseniaspora osmophila]
MTENSAPIQSNNTSRSVNVERNAVNVLVVKKKKKIDSFPKNYGRNVKSNNNKVDTNNESLSCLIPKSQSASFNEIQPRPIVHERVLRGSFPQKDSNKVPELQIHGGEDNTEEDSQDEKFDFDEHKIGITNESSLEFFRGKLPMSFAKISFPLTYMHKLKTLKSLNMEMKNTALETVTGISGIDPLNDALYENFHKHMCKEEKKMIQMDKIEAANLAERYETYLDTLNLVTWKYYLPKITKIENPQDNKEMERKKKLTIETITKLLSDYDSLKTLIKIRSFKLKNQDSLALPRGPLSKKIINPYQHLKSLPFVKCHTPSAQMRVNKNIPTVYQRFDRMFILDYESSSDEEESNLKTSGAIKSYRRKRVFEKYKYPTIIIRCEAFDIVAQPFQNPKIVKKKNKSQK